MTEILQKKEGELAAEAKPARSHWQRGVTIAAFSIVLAILGLMAWGLRRAQSGPIQI